MNAKNINSRDLVNFLVEGPDQSGCAKTKLSFYDIVYVIQSDTNKAGRDVPYKTANIDQLGINVTLAFTTKQLSTQIAQEGERVRAITVGMLCREIKTDSIEVIGLNFNLEAFEDFIFAAPFDKLTGQYIISPRDEAISLLSIDNESHRNMGVKATFFSITNKALEVIPQDKRKEYLNTLIDNLSFVIPRIPQPKGSANIICLLLNLENTMEERAFVRDYPTFEDYTEVLFVNSELELLAGDLSKIKYDGASLEGVYLPLIERQKNLTK